MANIFKNYTVTNVTANTAVVTCPANTVITVIGMTVSNVSGTLTDVSIKVNSAHILKDATIIGGSAIVPIGGEQKVVLAAGDSLLVMANNVVDVVVSVLEQV